MKRWIVGSAFLAMLIVPIGAQADEGAIPALVRALEDRDEASSSKAADALLAMGKAAVPGLKRALMASSRALRMQATSLLGKMGPKAVDATDLLIENLVDDFHPLVSETARTLGRLRSRRALEALRALEERSEQAGHRFSAYQGLALAGPEGAIGLRSAMRKGHERRAEVMRSLRGLGAESMPAVIALLGDESWHVRHWVVREGPPIKDMPDQWLQAVAAAGGDESGAVAHAATWRLATAQDPRVTPALTRLLSSSNPLVRREAAFGLSKIGPLEATSVSALLLAVRSSDSHLRFNAVCALGSAGDLGAVEMALRPLLADRERDIWIAAACSLAGLGYRGADAMPPLIHAVPRFGVITAPFDVHIRVGRDLGTGGGGRRGFVGRASIAGITGVPQRLIDVGMHNADLVEKAVRKSKGRERLRFVFALSRIGDAGFEPLTRLLKEKDLSTRMSAACCLARFGARGHVAIPALLAMAIRHEPGDTLVARAGEELEDREIVSEEPVIRAWPDTSWILESRDALIAIGPSALPAVKIAAKDPAIASRLASVLNRLKATPAPPAGK